MIRGWLILAALAGCHRPAPAISPPAPSPAATENLPQAAATTDGTIAVDNLEGQLAAFERAGPAHRAQLIALYQVRAQYLGRPDDYGRAEALAEALVKESPPGTVTALALLVRAGTRASLHRFAEAAADVAAAEKLGAPPGKVEALRASLWEATGRDDLARPIRQRRARAAPDIDTLGELAALDGRQGRIAEAERGFAAALASYRDVSPFIVAWIYFQNGLVEERAGRPAEAEAMYREAHQRLPAYAPATGHLAGILAAHGSRMEALRLLQPLADALDDPEYAGEYAALQQNDPAASARAAKRYDELLRKYPDAYADHAARFFLTRDKKRALELARRNLANRPTAEAFELAIEAALENGLAAEACTMADRAPSQARVAAARAYLRCGQKARAEALLAAPQPPAQ